MGYGTRLPDDPHREQPTGHRYKYSQQAFIQQKCAQACAQKRPRPNTIFGSRFHLSRPHFWSDRSDPTVARNYLHHLVEQIEVDENRITVVPKDAFGAMS